MKSTRKRTLTPESSPKESSARIDLPLECQHPEDFGFFDAEQHFFIDNGALDLVLIENASELMRRVMMEHGNIEKVLNLLSKTYDGCGVLPSETFPIYTSDIKEKWQNTGTEQEYRNAVEGMKRQYLKIIKKKNIKCVYAVFGLLVDEDGSGHYGSFHFNPATGSVNVFDSMQDSNFGSAYTAFFIRLAKDIFGVDNVQYDNRFSVYTSLQITGGFSANRPLMLEPKFAAYGTQLTETEKKTVMLESTESQNHFCYMWSIWSLHLRMIGQEPYDVAKDIYLKGIDPLIVIKRYIWSLFNHEKLRLIDQIPEKYQEFFVHHWPVIWSNDPLRMLIPNAFFNRYAIPLSQCKNLTDCVVNSYSNFETINAGDMTPLTSETYELIECARRKK